MQAGPGTTAVAERLEEQQTADSELASSATQAGPARAASATGEIPIGPDAPLLAVMATTRAMRRLRPDPVPDELLRSIIEAATWAPTGSNDQTEAFVLVTDRAVIAKLAQLWRRVVDDYRLLYLATAPARAADPAMVRMREAIEYQRDHFAETPAVIVACYDYRALKRSRRNVGVILRLIRASGLRGFVRLARASNVMAQRSQAGSIYPAVQNLLLAARAHGLAACMTTWHLLAESECKAVLRIPKDVETFAVIPIGWPVGRFGPVRREPVETVIHRDRW